MLFLLNSEACRIKCMLKAQLEELTMRAHALAHADKICCTLAAVQSKYIWFTYSVHDRPMPRGRQVQTSANSRLTHACAQYL